MPPKRLILLMRFGSLFLFCFSGDPVWVVRMFSNAIYFFKVVQEVFKSSRKALDDSDSRILNWLVYEWFFFSVRQSRQSFPIHSTCLYISMMHSCIKHVVVFLPVGWIRILPAFEVWFTVVSERHLAYLLTGWVTFPWRYLQMEMLSVPVVSLTSTNL